MTVAVGPTHMVAAASALGPDLLLVPAAGHLGGDLLVNTGHALLLTSIGAGLLSYHNTVARTVFALGRDRVLPGVFGRTNPATGAPRTASLAQSTGGFTVIAAFALGGWDPMTRLFFTTGITGALGVLLLLTAVSAATVAYFAADRRGERRRSAIVAPALAVPLLGGCMLLVVTHLAALLGVDPGSPWRWAPPGLYLAAAGTGVVVAARLGYRAPQHLLQVGRVTNAAHHPSATSDPVEGVLR
jgi:amino acid transporter